MAIGDTLGVKNKYIQALLAEGMNSSPIASPWQGASRMAHALLAGLEMRDLDRNERESLPAIVDILRGQQAATPSPSPASSPAVSADMSQPRGIRNNNPGNIIDSPFAKSQPGYAGTDGRFAKFDTADSGNSAIDKLLVSYGNRGINTVGGVINRWAPPSDNNPTSTYAATVAKGLGIDPNAPIDMADPAIRQKLAQGITQFENGRPAALPQQPQQAPAQSPARPAINTAQLDQLRALASHPNPNVRAFAAQLIQGVMAQQFKPPEFKPQVAGENLYSFNPQTGTATVAGSATKPTFTDIGDDPTTGKSVKGFVDASNQKVVPYRMAQPVRQSSIPPPPPGFDPKIWNEEHSKRGTKDAMAASSEEVQRLRKEVQDLPSYKNVAQAAPVYKSMLDAAGRDNRAADVNLIYGMAKIMDPGSVVRESEMTVAQAVSTIPQHLQATILSQLKETGRLSPDVRMAIMQEARSRMQAYQGMYDQDATMYRGIAERGRMQTQDVLQTFGPFDEFRAQAAAPTVAPPKVRKFNPTTETIE